MINFKINLIITTMYNQIDSNGNNKDLIRNNIIIIIIDKAIVSIDKMNMMIN